MTPADNNKNFMDRSTVLALLLVMVIWFGWSYFMEKRYPQANQAPPAATAVQPSAIPGAQQAAESTMNATTNATTNAVGANQPGVVQPESFTDYSDTNWSFQISSRGMGLKNIDIKTYKTREEKPVILGDVSERLPFATALAATDTLVDFQIEKTAPDTFVGHANIQGLEVTKTLTFDAAHFKFSTVIEVKNPPADFKGLTTYLSGQLPDVPKAGFMSRSYDNEEFYLRHDNTKTRSIVTRQEGLTLSEKNITLVALSSHYFALAIVDNSDILPRFETIVPVAATTIIGRIVHQPVNKTDLFTVKYTGFAGPKLFSLLDEADPNLTSVINYGMFSVIAAPLLWLMKFLFSIFGNYGVAIIVMTLIVRLIVLPINVYSFRSMKAMQKIQPLMAAVRERYKNDPTTMNQEVMKLMKEHKANPMGGCLPMLLQLPVFFALYQVLGQSIELYRAPFIFWIHDLSAKDPYFVLPVLMGITMFVNQKMTPTAMDPQQAKVLMWMPLIFSFFMISLPSGLTLYIFISTLFGIVQQYVFMKERTPNTSVKAANA